MVVKVNVWVIVGLMMAALCVGVRAEELPSQPKSNSAPVLILEQAPVTVETKKLPVTESVSAPAPQSSPVLNVKKVETSEDESDAELESLLEDTTPVDDNEAGWKSSRSHRTPVRVVMGPAFFVSKGQSILGASVSATSKVAEDAPLYLGFDLAYFGQRPEGSAHRRDTLVPTVAAIWSFVDEGEVRPYLGFGIGMAVSIHDWAKKYDLAANIKMGFDLLLGEQVGLNVETGMGMYGRQNYFVPRANLLINF